MVYIYNQRSLLIPSSSPLSIDKTRRLFWETSCMTHDSADGSVEDYPRYYKQHFERATHRPAMRKQQRLSFSVPVPANVPPSAVIDTMRSIEPFLRHVGFMSSFKHLPSSVDVFASDPWFIAPYDEIFNYELEQNITLMPGLTRISTSLIYMQRSGDKVRGRANNVNANINVWTEFSVRSKQSPASPASATTSSSTATMSEAEEFELVEDAVLEANSLMMPFITPVTIVAHKDLLKKLVEEAAKNYFNGVQYEDRMQH